MSNHYSSRLTHSDAALYACAEPEVLVLIDKATDAELVVLVRDLETEQRIREMLEAVSEP